MLTIADLKDIVCDLPVGFDSELCIDMSYWGDLCLIIQSPNLCAHLLPMPARNLVPEEFTPRKTGSPFHQHNPIPGKSKLK